MITTSSQMYTVYLFSIISADLEVQRLLEYEQIFCIQLFY